MADTICNCETSLHIPLFLMTKIEPCQKPSRLSATRVSFINRNILVSSNNGLAVIASLKSAISRNEAPDLILSQFLASNNIDVNEATLAAMEELVQYVQQSRPVEDTGNERVERSGSISSENDDDSNSDFLMDDSNSDTTDDGSVDHDDDPF